MLKKIAWSLLALFLLAQFVRPDRANPALDPSLGFQTVASPPGEVLEVLTKACYDCHSFETRYPWYSQMAPVSWWVASHVKEGREHLNFSEFGKLSPSERFESLGEAAETVREGEMPLPSYTWLGFHPEAKLSATQRDLLLQWLDANGGEGEKGGGSEKADDD